MSSGKTRNTTGTKVMYAAAIIVAIIAIAYLVNTALFFKIIINQYVNQGYKAADVFKNLYPSQLLPGLLSSLIYLGVAVLLWATGIINQKLSLCVEKFVPTEITEEETVITETVISEPENVNTDTLEEPAN